VTGYGAQGPSGPRGPLDDPSNRPTRMASYDVGDPQLPASEQLPEYAETTGPAEPPAPEGPPEPWYRNRVLLIAWALAVAILVVLIIYGLIELSHGVEGGPTTSTPSTSHTRSSTPSPSSTTTPSPSTTPPPPPPPSSSPEQEGPPDDNGPAPSEAPPPAEAPHHHHHLPHIPSTITLPHTVITLPPGF
jgi:cytoskeletal protein RodZ